MHFYLKIISSTFKCRFKSTGNLKRISTHLSILSSTQLLKCFLEFRGCVGKWSRISSFEHFVICSRKFLSKFRINNFGSFFPIFQIFFSFQKLFIHEGLIWFSVQRRLIDFWPWAFNEVIGIVLLASIHNK